MRTPAHALCLSHTVPVAKLKAIRATSLQKKNIYCCTNRMNRCGVESKSDIEGVVAAVKD